MIGVIFMIRYIFVLLFLTSCNNLPIAYIQNFSSVNNVVFGFSDYEITPEIYEEYEYSFIKIRFKRGPHSILILSFVEDDIFEWAGLDGVKVFTQNGRVIKTEGLTHDFEIINPRLRSPEQVMAFRCNINANRNFILSIFSKKGCQDKRLSAFSNIEKLHLYSPDLFSASMRVRINHTTQIIERLGEKIETKVLKEFIDIPSIAWTKENSYYADMNSGLILKSEQFLHPRLPVARIEFYYKY